MIPVAEVATVVLGSMAAATGCAGAIKWIFTPHMRLAIVETIKETTGAELMEVPKLTIAVRDLTRVLEEEAAARGVLAKLIEANTARISQLEDAVRDLSPRTRNRRKS